MPENVKNNDHNSNNNENITNDDNDKYLKDITNNILRDETFKAIFRKKTQKNY
ncbi:MAG: hypothetical protein LBD03_09655 [Methanobrevibacter sp.]|jgi:hypothetical protein|nr:hypothetical protein [Candidatus Methanovirga procula]